MKKRIVAVVLLVALIISLVPFVELAQVRAAIDHWDKGASIVSTYPEDFASENAKASLRKMREAGVNNVSFILQHWQNSINSNEIGNSATTPTTEALVSAIQYAHSIGLKVTLKPHVDTTGNGRSYIAPTDDDAWMQSYTNMLMKYVNIAKENNIEQIIIGTELISMAVGEVDPQNTVRWRNLISEIRKVYSGQLTYSANWGGCHYCEEASHIEFWDALDSIGISAYYEFRTGGNDVENIKSIWSNWNRTHIQWLAEKYNKPILFAEIGYRSMNDARLHPWNFSDNKGVNEQEQANLYEALFSYWSTQSYFKGVHLWHFETNPNAGGSGNSNFTPQNKLAEQVMKKWFGPVPDGTGSNPGTTPNNPPTTPSNPVPPGTGQNPDSNPITGSAFKTVFSTYKTTAGQFININLYTINELNNVIIDVEVYNESGQRVFQKVFENQNYQRYTGKSFHSYAPNLAPGKYTVKIGVFSADWQANYFWDSNVGSFVDNGIPSNIPPVDPDVLPQTPTQPQNPNSTTNNPPANPPQNPPTTPTTTPNNPAQNPNPSQNYTMDIWWPTHNGKLYGIMRWKAVIRELKVDEYSMSWSIPGDSVASHEMYNSHVGGLMHKQDTVDMAGIRWNGNGPYDVTFTAKDLSGNVIATQTITIYGNY